MKLMKTGIHPTYHDNVTVTCACGNSFVTGSTVESIQVEICAACHPFFTGQSKLMDTAGRVDKFKARLAAAKAAQTRKVSKKPRAIPGELVETKEAPTEPEIKKTKEQPNEK